jgi:hypothetical protein
VDLLSTINIAASAKMQIDIRGRGMLGNLSNGNGNTGQK